MDMQQEMAGIKRQFFTYRNGVVADVMRRGGSPYRMIFGLTLPQVSAIAERIGIDDRLSRALWADSEVRESQILATMVADTGLFTVDDAVDWTVQLRSVEIADILSLKLLRRMPCVDAVVMRLCDGGMSAMQRYTGLRAAFALAGTQPDMVAGVARRELECDEPLTAAVARQLLANL